MRIFTLNIQTLLRGLVLSGFVCSASACQSAGAYEQSVYRDRLVTFAVDPPTDPEDGATREGFERIRLEGQSGLAWANGDGSVLQVSARCDRSLDIPLAALKAHLLIGFTERKEIEERLLPMDGREALETHLRAKVDGVARELILRVLKKDGCVYDLALIARPGEPFEHARPYFERVAESFTTEVPR